MTGESMDGKEEN